ncbi:MAG: DUF6797 domain-containing protein [Planctomycetota bacterium]
MTVRFLRRFITLLFTAASFVILSGEPVTPTYKPGDAVPVEPANEASWVDGRWNQTNVGSFLSSGIRLPGGHIQKGISIRLGADDASVCFDSKNLGVRAVWTGGFLKFDGARYGLIQWPKPVGPFMLTLPEVPCWGAAKTHYIGLHLNDKRVMLDYRVNDMIVFDSPWVEKDGETLAVSRSFQFAPSTSDESCVLGDIAAAELESISIDGVSISLLKKGELVVAFATVGGSDTTIKIEKARVSLVIPKHDNIVRTKVLIWSGKKADLPKFAALVKKSPPAEDLIRFVQPGAPRWGAPLVVNGKVSAEKSAYVVDTITVPHDNPYKAMMFFAGLDFFKNGDAAICTLHGDVWRVSGINDTLDHVTWQRFATGLFQPLGLKIIDDKVFVLGRDQITELHDSNNDGEADFYANFNNDMKTSQGGHDYSACLETDRAGNFYHVDPYGIHRISKDGKTYETVASGWRNPVSMGVGPNDELTVSPQQGTWTPSSLISLVKKGGWYGFGGPKITPENPLGYERPLCYIPHKIENSTGGHTWVDSDKWGPFNGQMLNLSFGQAIVQVVLRETIDGQNQAGVVTFPARFLAGTMRGRFRNQDGQLYVVGTKGWQTVAPNDGAFQRMRYTGATVYMPSGLHVYSNGIRVEFTQPLKREEAEDADNYSVAQWNYAYTKAYGSDDWSVEHPEKKGRDEVAVKSVKLLPDGKSVFIEIKDVKPVMQMQIKYKLVSESGEKVRGDIYNTINKVGALYSKP